MPRGRQRTGSAGDAVAAARALHTLKGLAGTLGRWPCRRAAAMAKRGPALPRPG